jgi:methyl-accepting chemotaxis protein
MHSPQHRDDMTLTSWLSLTALIAIALPIGAIFALVLIALPLLAPSSAGAFVAIAVATTTMVSGGCVTEHLLLRHKMTSGILRLVDLCRESAGGDHTVRAEVLGDDAFALLCASFNSLLDAQGIDSRAQGDASLGYRPNSMLALQAQVERLQRLVEQAIQDQEEETFSRSISMLTETFSSMIATLAQVIGQVQDVSLQMMTVIHEVDGEWRTQIDEQSTQLIHLVESRDAQGAQVEFLQRSSQHADLARTASEGIEQQAMTSKQSIYQSLEALYQVLEKLEKTSGRAQTLEQLATDMLQVTGELDTFAGHLTLLSSKGSSDQSVQTESLHPIVEADLVYLA